MAHKTVSGVVRATPLIMLVTEGEAARVAVLAAAAGLTESAYLRVRAPAAPGEEAAELAALDGLIERMERDLDGATAALSASLERLSAA